MSREKIKYFFRKNHIEILKIEHPEHVFWGAPVYEHVSVGTVVPSNSSWHEMNKKQKYEEVVKVSPLGFYYTKKVPVKTDQYYKNSNGCISRTIISYPVPGEEDAFYQVKYVTQYDQNKIGNEDGLRPWDIYPGDKDFSDNMLKGLITEINKFFDLAESAQITSFYKDPSCIYYVNANQGKKIDFYNVKSEVFKELFGNIKGPRFQTNEEKILAHGFDTKYSFRKDKEVK